MTEFVRQQGVAAADEAAWRRKTAVMCRILGMQGSIGLFGHISVRIPGSDVVLITPGAGSEKTAVRTDEIFVFGLDGAIHDHPGATGRCRSQPSGASTRRSIATGRK